MNIVIIIATYDKRSSTNSNVNARAEDDDKNDTYIETTLRLLTIFVTRLYLYIRTRLTCTRARLSLLVGRLNMCGSSVLIVHSYVVYILNTM